MPSRITRTIDAPAVIVVTGANGFIAQHCIARLLQHGYHVVGTVRSAAKAEVVHKSHGWHSSLDVVVIQDITDPQSYLDALEAFSPSAIFHLAAPFHYSATSFEKEMMVPAVQGSTAILEAAARMRGVRRVVHTNSFACIYDASAGLCPEKVYTARDWSPLTYEDGVAADNAPLAYRASKTAAEKAAWRFMEQRGLGFDLVSLCPGMVFGPFLPDAMPKSTGEINTSNFLVWSVVSAGRGSAVPPTRGPIWVDVRDVADAHIKALIVPEAGGGRYMLAKGAYCNQELADVARQVSPKLRERVPIGEPGKREAHMHYTVDTTETDEVLGTKWRSLEESLGDLVPQLFEIERAHA
ncbi:Putative uncharacterized oxidoreductase [Cladobotryum mycophilum]|uniref:Uncharacterized oxidoreductase n=1 Tax=Cladobotryum mycophilum TaxID=491253 RepID=A0ABR0STI7_9HYPO